MKLLEIEHCYQCKHHIILRQEELPQGFIKSTYGCQLTREQHHYEQQGFPSSCQLKDVNKKLWIFSMFSRTKNTWVEVARRIF